MKTKKSFGLLMPIIFGFGAVVLAAALASLLAYGIVAEFITKDLAEFLVPVIIAVAVFAASLVAAVNAGAQGRGLAALCCAGVYFVVCVFAKLLLFPGSTQYLLRNFIVCAGASVAAIAVGSRGGNRKKPARARKRR